MEGRSEQKDAVWMSYILGLQACDDTQPSGHTAKVHPMP